MQIPQQRKLTQGWTRILHGSMLCSILIGPLIIEVAETIDMYMAETTGAVCITRALPCFTNATGAILRLGYFSENHSVFSRWNIVEMFVLLFGHFPKYFQVRNVAV